MAQELQCDLDKNNFNDDGSTNPLATIREKDGVKKKSQDEEERQPLLQGGLMYGGTEIRQQREREGRLREGSSYVIIWEVVANLR